MVNRPPEGRRWARIRKKTAQISGMVCAYLRACLPCFLLARLVQVRDDPCLMRSSPETPPALHRSGPPVRLSYITCLLLGLDRVIVTDFPASRVLIIMHQPSVRDIGRDLDPRPDRDSQSSRHRIPAASLSLSPSDGLP